MSLVHARTCFTSRCFGATSDLMLHRTCCIANQTPTWCAYPRILSVRPNLTPRSTSEARWLLLEETQSCVIIAHRRLQQRESISGQAGVRDPAWRMLRTMALQYLPPASSCKASLGHKCTCAASAHALAYTTLLYGILCSAAEQLMAAPTWWNFPEAFQRPISDAGSAWCTH